MKIFDKKTDTYFLKLDSYNSRSHQKGTLVVYICDGTGIRVYNGNLLFINKDGIERPSDVNLGIAKVLGIPLNDRGQIYCEELDGEEE